MDARCKKMDMIVSMDMIMSKASYTKNNKIELYLHFKNTRERRSEFGVMEELQKLCSIFSLEHSQFKSNPGKM